MSKRIPTPRFDSADLRSREAMLEDSTIVGLAMFEDIAIEAASWRLALAFKWRIVSAEQGGTGLAWPKGGFEEAGTEKHSEPQTLKIMGFQDRFGHPICFDVLVDDNTRALAVGYYYPNGEERGAVIPLLPRTAA